MLTLLGKPLRGPSPLTRLALLALLSAVLMMLDHRTQQLERVRAALTVLVYPIQVAASAPAALYRGVADLFTTDAALRTENERLAAERRELLVQLQRLEALEQDNERLRAMLGAGAQIAGRTLVAELWR